MTSRGWIYLPYLNDLQNFQIDYVITCDLVGIYTNPRSLRLSVWLWYQNTQYNILDVYIPSYIKRHKVIYTYAKANKVSYTKWCWNFFLVWQRRDAKKNSNVWLFGQIWEELFSIFINDSKFFSINIHLYINIHSDLKKLKLTNIGETCRL